jgi:hypothetical protein
MSSFSAGDAVRRVSEALGRAVDVVIVNTALPPQAVLARYQAEHKDPLPMGDVPAGCEIVEAPLWNQRIARHDRRRLAYSVWTVLAKRML